MWRHLRMTPKTKGLLTPTNMRRGRTNKVAWKGRKGFWLPSRSFNSCHATSDDLLRYIFSKGSSKKMEKKANHWESLFLNIWWLNCMHYDSQKRPTFVLGSLRSPRYGKTKAQSYNTFRCQFRHQTPLTWWSWAHK